MGSSDLMHLPDGRHLCCICFGAFTKEELAPVEDEPGMVWDVCIGCEAAEQKMKAERWCQVAKPHTAHGVCDGWPR